MGATPEQKRAWAARNADRVREQSRAGYLRNRERYLERARQRRDADPEAWAERRRELAATPERKAAKRVESRRERERDPEAARERNRRYRARHRERLNAEAKARLDADPERKRRISQTRDANRRARKLAGAPDLTAAEWRATVEVFAGRCAYCWSAAEVLHLEHMTPLARGGRHARDNVVPACESCNKRKATRTAEEYGAWFLQPCQPQP